MTSIIDFTELQEQVMEHWNDQGVIYFYSETVTTDPCPMYQTLVKEEYLDMLNDPITCLAQLGFDSFSQYMREMA